jgi:hypothetical protein
MNLRRWWSIILVTGLILALNALSAQADPYRPYHRPHGHAYGWDGPRYRGYDHHHKHFRNSCRGPRHTRYGDRVYQGPPAVAYVTPVAPVIGIPYSQPQQPYYSQPAAPGFSGQLNFGF